MQVIVDSSGLPFATGLTDKSVLNEGQPAYLGMNVGRLRDDDVRQFVESDAAVLTVGTFFSDLNMGAFTAKIDPARLISINLHDMVVRGRRFPGVEMADVLAALAPRMKRRNAQIPPHAGEAVGARVGSGSDAITAAALYPRWADFLRPDDVVVAEAGTTSVDLGLEQLSSDEAVQQASLP